MANDIEELNDHIDASIAKNIRPVLFFYDIPTDSGFPNPSGYLRRFAVRINKSDWVMSESDVPHPLILEMLKVGATPRVVRFHDSENMKLVRMAIESLREEIAEHLKRAADSQKKSDRQLEDSNDEPEKAHDYYLKRSEDIKTRLGKLCEDMETVIGRFGILPTALKIDTLRTTSNAISNAMETRARAYMEAANKARMTKTSDGEAIAKSIEANQMDPMIAADFLDEHEMGSGESLRKAFQDRE